MLQLESLHSTGNPSACVLSIFRRNSAVMLCACVCLKLEFLSSVDIPASFHLSAEPGWKSFSRHPRVHSSTPQEQSLSFLVPDPLNYPDRSKHSRSSAFHSLPPAPPERRFSIPPAFPSERKYVGLGEESGRYSTPASQTRAP